MRVVAVIVSPATVDGMSDRVTTTISEGVATIRLDDGKANAIGHDTIDALSGALDQAEADADAVALFGREGKFSAGFDLEVMKAGAEASQALVGAGAELSMRIYGFPRPVVAGSDGHALAMGALLLLSCDVRIGSDSPAKIGLPEVAIGMPLPVFGTELARDRLSKRHFTAATALATIYSPEQALDVGFLDEVVSAGALEKKVMDRASALGESLGPGFAQTRRNARGATIDHVLATLNDDLATFNPS